MQNQKQPNTVPMLFRTHAQLEMRKTQDSGCLCKPCESFTLLHRGVTGACAAIQKILDRIRDTENLSTKTKFQKSVLEKIKDVIATPSKYDTVVEYLQPCLSTGKLEGVAYICLIETGGGADGEKGCNICGFKQWWSNVLKKAFSMMTVQ